MWQQFAMQAPRRAVTRASMLTVLVLMAGGVQSVGAGVETIKRSPAVEKPATEALPSVEGPLTAAPGQGLVTTPVPIRSAPVTLQPGDLGGVRTWKPIQAAGGGEGEAASPPSADVPVVQAASLAPGSGFVGATVEPQIVGDLAAPGATAKAIARWDALPEELLADTRNLGVVAFHINGIDRVEFSLNGGPWLSSRKMELNKDTGVWEYIAPLDPKKLADGAFEVRAIAYPTVGQPRLLESLTLVANSGGSVPQKVMYVSVTGDDVGGDGSAAKPYQTIWKAAKTIELQNGAPYYASNGTVYLKEGKHLYSGRPNGAPFLKTPSGWITIAAAPGVTRERVVINGSTLPYGGLQASKVKFQDITLVSVSLQTSGTAKASAWFNRCVLEGSGTTDMAVFAKNTVWTEGSYYTDSAIRNLANGPSGARMSRNCEISNIGSDALQNPRLVLNCKVRDILKPAGTSFHPDLMQFSGKFDNVIVYGLEAFNINAQGIFNRGEMPDKNIALVNIAIDQRTHWSQWSKVTDHLLLWNITLLGRPFNFRNDPTGTPLTLTNFSVRDSIFETLALDPTAVPPGVRPSIIRNNHFITGAMIGSDATAGPVDFTGGTSGDPFAPRTGSPLLRRVMRPLAPTDALGREREVPSAIGAMDPMN